MTRYSSTMREILSTIREGKSVKENPEDMQPASPDEGGMAKDQLEFMKYAADEIMQHIENGGEFPEWMQNKLSGTFEKMKSLHANIDHSNVENVKEELEEGAFNKLNLAAKDLAKYAAKDKNGLDYKDFMKAAAMMKTGKVKELVKFVDNLDTEPRDAIIMQVKDALGKDAAEKMFQVSIRAEFDLDEMKMDDPKLVKAFDKLKRGDTIKLKTSSTISKGTDFVDYVVKAKNVVNKGKVEKVTLVTKGNEKAVKKFLYKRDGKVTFAIGDMGASIDDIKEETLRELEEGKSSTGYELYHKDFSSAMKHAYDFAKKKFGIEVDPKEIDDKVASGPRKPSKGKTNSYRLMGKDGKKAIQVQVYGMDNGKYELNMYKEGVEPIQWPSQPLEEKLKVSDGLGAWIDDFKKSDAPQFAGKSDEEKKNMAIAAFTDAGGKLDEMAYKPGSFKDIRPQEKAAKALDALIKSGGLDKSDFQKARAMYVQASDMQSRKKLKDFISNLDTEPLEAILDIIGRNDPDTFQKMYPKSKPGEYLSTIAYNHRNAKNEETELDEAVDAKKVVAYLIKKGNNPKEAESMVKKELAGAIKAYPNAPVAKIAEYIRSVAEELNEMREPYAVVDTADGNKVVGTASDEKGAKSIITSAELPPMKIKDKKTLKIVKVKKKQMIGQPIKEEEEPNKPDTAKAVDQGREDKKKTRIAQLQLQIAKAQETINKLNAQEKPNG